jgi:hypothetical protein
MLTYWFTEQLSATLAVIFSFAVWIVAVVYNGNLAWRYPSKLKNKYYSQVERWPTWAPFRNIYLRHYQSNGFVWSVRIFTVIGLLFPIGLLILMILGLTGIIK